MRDLIWTLILVWLVYKLVDVFKSLNAKKPASSVHQTQQNHAASGNGPKRDIKSAIQKHLNNEGEYVDFEEVK